MHSKDFDNWNKEKQIINKNERQFYFATREIWWCALGINVGAEIDGKNNKFERPILIMKYINQDMILILPLSTKGYISRTQIRIRTEKILSFVKISQLRVISTKRLLRKLDILPEDQFSHVQEKLINFVS